MGDFAILLRAGFTRFEAVKLQLLTASGGIIGAITAFLVESVQSTGNILNEELAFYQLLVFIGRTFWSYSWFRARFMRINYSDRFLQN